MKNRFVFTADIPRFFYLFIFLMRLIRNKLESGKASNVFYGTDRETSGLIQTHFSFCMNRFLIINITIFSWWHQNKITSKSLLTAAQCTDVHLEQ